MEELLKMKKELIWEWKAGIKLIKLEINHRGNFVENQVREIILSKFVCMRIIQALKFDRKMSIHDFISEKMKDHPSLKRPD